MTTLFTILFDGVAYGMLLFVLACGLAVTLGLMNFVNLAHGAFAMAGGYICAVLVNNQSRSMTHEPRSRRSSRTEAWARSLLRQTNSRPSGSR